MSVKVLIYLVYVEKKLNQHSSGSEVGLINSLANMGNATI